MAREQRKSPRIPICCAGTINGAGPGAMPCIVMDVSAGGAQVRLFSDAELPHRFTLNLSRNGAVRRWCEVAWRSGNCLGLRFVDPATQAISRLKDEAHG